MWELIIDTIMEQQSKIATNCIIEKSKSALYWFYCNKI